MIIFSRFLAAVIIFFCFLPSSFAAYTINNLPTGGYRVDGYGTSQTASNPQGQSASSSGGGAAGVSMGANFPVVIGSPPGAGVPLALAGGAAAVFASTQLSSGQYAPVITNPSAAISAAAQMMTTAGFLAAGTPAGIPLMAAGAAVGLIPTLCAAVSGCQWLQSMAAQGVALSPSGAALIVNNNDLYLGQPLSYWSNLCVATPVGAGFLSPSVFNVIGNNGHPIYQCQKQNATYLNWGWNSANANPANVTFSAAGVPTSAPATNDQIVAAIHAATADNNRAAATAAQNAAAADMVNLALLGQMSLNGLNETAAFTNIASAFTQQSTALDSLGNVVQQLSRNVTSMTPGANASLPPVLQNTVQAATITNGTVTSSVQTTAAPSSPAPPVAVATAQPYKDLDLCVAHPEILACANITTLSDLPAVAIPNTNKTLSALVPVALGGLAVCPPPLLLPGLMGSPPISLDLAKPVCNFASSIKAINLLIASLACFWIVSAGFKNG